MDSFKKTFIRDFMIHASNAHFEAASILENTLSRIWQEFREGYEHVSIDDIDGRYSKFLTIYNTNWK